MPSTQAISTPGLPGPERLDTSAWQRSAIVPRTSSQAVAGRRLESAIYMGFVFVDRITAFDTDHARGQLHRAAGAPPLPHWLVLEAVGQLAAWIAMARSEFVNRPVAALLTEARIGSPAVGGVIDLEARIDRFDGRAILYSGTASVAGRVVSELARGVGPLLPADLFDDPSELRRRFEALRGPAPVNACGAADPLPCTEISGLVLGTGSGSAQLRVPESAPFFLDHFPRRPVYPATLLAAAQNQLAIPLAAQTLGVEPARLRPSRVVDFKVRSFSPPGQLLELTAEARTPERDGIAIAVAASSDGKRIASGVLEYRLAPPHP